MNNVFLSKWVITASIVVLLAAVFSTDADARYTKRSDRWESTFKLVHSQAERFDGEGGSSLDLKSDYGWGFSLGYNLNPHITLNYDFSFTTPTYTAYSTVDVGDGEPLAFQQKMETFESQFNVIYNLFASQFTPYIQAGAGWTYMDSNIANGPPVGGCWWTWYGYYCDGYQPTYDKSNFSYNVAAGVRYELNNGLFFRASYKQDFIDISHADDASIGSYHFEIGSTF